MKIKLKKEEEERSCRMAEKEKDEMLYGMRQPSGIEEEMGSVMWGQSTFI